MRLVLLPGQAQNTSLPFYAVNKNIDLVGNVTFNVGTASNTLSSFQLYHCFSLNKNICYIKDTMNLLKRSAYLITTSLQMFRRMNRSDAHYSADKSRKFLLIVWNALK